MPINLTCPNCHRSLKVSDEQAGKKARCPGCEGVIEIPALAKPAPPTSTDGLNAGRAPTQASPAAPPPSQNPYSDTSAGISRQEAQVMRGHGNVLQPLLEAKFFLQIVAWSFIVGGVLYCLTIIGIIIGWLPIWMGLTLKKAYESLEAGSQHGDQAQLLHCSQNLATFFKIVGVLVIIQIVIMAIYLLVIIVAVIAAVASNA